ncbi:hypothetical protein [Polymorphospora rubra]|uniref:Uncharacterized protein n=1 Tax=Polymorphospora rubra TaxID=338584 RepID=A0A810MSA6_9ACTN|nr:hypothetical protein [Polymorphospora rubra]BCJ64126.1 hypothetical protein Prubr_11470 [Polymorphospora rubra]
MTLTSPSRAGATRALATPRLATNARSRPCPKCGAEPGQACRTRAGGRVQGVDTGGGYTRPLKHVHAERKRPRAVNPDPPPATRGPHVDEPRLARPITTATAPAHL